MNILDYLDWRGDLPFERVELNHVDALIFAWLAYYRFEELDDEALDGLTLRELVVLREQRLGPFVKPSSAKSILPTASAAWLLRCTSKAERFANVRVKDFRRTADANQGIQFAAISFLIGNALRVIAYRGTDSTLAGWKEDCRLSFLDSVPAQSLAVQYLADAANGEELVVCGHSKGGNLSMYAALCAPEACVESIRTVYDFDGPGFCFDIRDMDRYARLNQRCIKIVPESSIVGMLLNHAEDYRIVKSRMVGLFQHDAMFWQVLGGDFIYTDRRSASSVVMDNALREWIESMSNPERRDFVDALFDILEGTGAVYTDELPEKLLCGDGLKRLACAASVYPEQTKMLLRLLMEMVRASNANLYDSVVHSSAMRDFIQGVSEGGGRLLDRAADAVAELFTSRTRDSQAAQIEGDDVRPDDGK